MSHSLDITSGISDKPMKMETADVFSSCSDFQDWSQMNLINPAFVPQPSNFENHGTENGCEKCLNSVTGLFAEQQDVSTSARTWRFKISMDKKVSTEDDSIPQFGPKKFQKSYYSHESFVDTTTSEFNGLFVNINRNDEDSGNILSTFEPKTESPDAMQTDEDKLEGRKLLSESHEECMADDFMISPENVLCQDDSEENRKSVKRSDTTEYDANKRVKKETSDVSGDECKMSRRFKNTTGNDYFHVPPLILSRPMRKIHDQIPNSLK